MAASMDTHGVHYALHSHLITLTATEGPKCYKTYRRGGKVFWRNYHRDVPGGVSFLRRFTDALEYHAARQREYLAQSIFTRAEGASP